MSNRYSHSRKIKWEGSNIKYCLLKKTLTITEKLRIISVRDKFHLNTIPSLVYPSQSPPPTHHQMMLMPLLTLDNYYT